MSYLMLRLHHQYPFISARFSLRQMSGRTLSSTIGLGVEPPLQATEKEADRCQTLNEPPYLFTCMGGISRLAAALHGLSAN